MKIDSISENDADPATAAIFADIKSTLNIAAVNLVWRHLATVGDSLPQVWSRLKPLYQDVGLRAAALRVSKAADMPRPAPTAPRALSPRIRHDLVAVLENYQRSNPSNLVALFAVRASLDGLTPSARATSDQTSPPALRPLPALPRLIPVTQMNARCVVDGLALNNLGLAKASEDLVAGVPRHLANWPEVLSECVKILQPFERALPRAMHAVQDQARREGQLLAGAIEPFATDTNINMIRTALGHFTALDLIANYIVKVRVLLDAFDPNSAGFAENV